MRRNKLLSRVLMSLNGLVILGLLIFSGLLLYFSNASPPTLLGTRAILQDTGQNNQLVLFKPGEPPAEGGQVLLREPDGTIAIGRQAQLGSDGLVRCTLPAGESRSLTPSSPDYLGRVTGVSRFWGELFARATAPNQIAITYVSIVVVFLLCLLLLAILYMVMSRRSPAPAEEEEEPVRRENEEPEPRRSARPVWAPRDPFAVPARRRQTGPLPQTPASRRSPASAADRPISNRPVPERTASERTPSERTPSERTPSERTPSERTGPEEDVKIFRSGQKGAAIARVTDRYAAPHILRAKADARVSPQAAPARRAPPPPPRRETVPPRRAVVLREQGDPYDLYDMGPSISELLQDLDKLQ